MVLIICHRNIAVAQSLPTDASFSRHTQRGLQGNKSLATQPDMIKFEIRRCCQKYDLEMKVLIRSVYWILQIESRLENPTKYHMLESQRKQVSKISKLAAMFFFLDEWSNRITSTKRKNSQVADFLSEGESSLPPPERTALTVSPGPGFTLLTKTV